MFGSVLIFHLRQNAVQADRVIAIERVCLDIHNLEVQKRSNQFIFRDPNFLFDKLVYFTAISPQL